MSLKLYIRDAETGNRIEVEATPTNSVEDLIHSAASYWKKDPGAYVLRQGKRILQAESKVKDLGLISEDVLELMPDPEGGSPTVSSAFGKVTRQGKVTAAEGGSPTAPSAFGKVTERSGVTAAEGGALPAQGPSIAEPATGR